MDANQAVGAGDFLHDNAYLIAGLVVLVAVVTTAIAIHLYLCTRAAVAPRRKR
ncbi:hypothetical protein LWP59_32380 [Amycolatopsis acidiphila]|uniref:hypothetical protein n=1 Tax=Amycolatopsis acidiphila TaxID=715473 RepID=UPI001643A645|nr:hypothetical protein [Amycolatopsis acidiphila]UIJ58746.1 hypothetical protein LWP59_32380 [Amycolatopsis acidiphila]GHG71691.1 hypothetical protein GCM10017788_33580 [Amycolatopsis acidiphila]